MTQAASQTTKKLEEKKTVGLLTISSPRVHCWYTLLPASMMDTQMSSRRRCSIYCQYSLGSWIHVTYIGSLLLTSGDGAYVDCCGARVS